MQKKIVIILLISALLFGGGYAGYRVFGGTYRSVLRQYCKAVASNDGEKALSLIQTEYLNHLVGTYGEDVKEVADYLTEEVQRWHELLEEKCGKGFKASYSITDITEYSSEGLEALSTQLNLSDDKLINSAYLISLQFNAKGKTDDYYGNICKVSVYRSGKRWYLKFDDGKMF